ncbi:MAG: leucine--tRNA ligase [Dehalococcoidia bacterium]|nr:leucine--tRNA ligase [Dehalococcoidia bacterium]MDW8119218.1 leucine--tRNA ligase [Chloroflexota bacterium]
MPTRDGKYAPLRRLLELYPDIRLTLTFEEVEQGRPEWRETAYGFRGVGPLPPSSRHYRQWWANTRSHVQARAWLDAGWRVVAVDGERQRVTFERVLTEPRWEPQIIEPKWQARWEQAGLHRVPDRDARPKWYELTMYPYPSGDLHIGHWYAMAPSDTHARFRRMQGYRVLHPMGFDAFGLPAENAAIRHGIHPFTWTMQNIERMRKQLRSIGAIYDWEREVNTCVPEYYKWNQWLFLQFYKHGLAYRSRAPVVWCPSCQTVLANEQVVNGRCERCATPITRREMEQWFLRITKYADELLDFSGLVDWPERILTMQRNWIGRSEGVEVDFSIAHLGLPEKHIRVFTTRIDTIYGVTFLVLAPEHPLVPLLTTPERRAQVEAYVENARRQSDIERLSTEREKTGIFLGTYCINPYNGQRVPIFTADYAVAWYATGAVMGVPAHDQRDFEFARRFGLPITVVVAPEGWDGKPLERVWEGPGVMVNSGPFTGMPNDRAKQAMADYAERQGFGKRAVVYRMRDWLISRQRYWGTPIPIVYCSACGIVPVPEKDLPVLLPLDAQFKPTGESPLLYHENFLRTTCPQCQRPARRESDTMDTFVDSSWYFLRYISPKDTDRPWDPDLVRHWLPVDQYTGGAEHAVMHLLYARFFVKALRDMGLLHFSEPFLRLYNQGVITYLGEKMSKSRGNVVPPDPYVERLGADTVRVYLMFLGPWEKGGDWSVSGINGATRWLNRVWDLLRRPPSALAGKPVRETSQRIFTRKLHQTIKKVYHDLDGFQFNTAIAALMDFTNALQEAWERADIGPDLWHEAVEKTILMLAPIVPHLAEELWEQTGHAFSVHTQSFPQWDETLAAAETVTLVVQVDGKVRDRIPVPADLPEEEAKRRALQSPHVQRHLNGRRVQRIVFVPGRMLVNIVTQ